MAKETVKIPDLGGAEEVEVIEISVAPGDEVSEEQALMVLESDKATMDVPSPVAGKVIRILVKEGDTVSAGSEIVEMELADTGAAETDNEEAASDADDAESSDSEAGTESRDPAAAEPSGSDAADESRQESGGSERVFELPDLGTDDEVEVIELSVSVGDRVEEGQALGMLESDKATMDVPAPFAGEVLELLVKEGDKVGTGAPFAKLRTASGAPEESATERGSDAGKAESADADQSRDSGRSAPASSASEPQPTATRKSAPPGDESVARAQSADVDSTPGDLAQTSEGGRVYAGPAVRQLARELGVVLEQVAGSGPKGRIQKDDLKRFVKEAVNRSSAPGATGGALPAVPEVDFAQFGEVELVPMSKIQVLTAANMQRSWLNAPHVTHFDDADITELEAFRKSLKAESEKRKVKITPLPFLLQAAAKALREHPQFNRSLHSDGKHFVQKDYVHIGIAVDTPRGLLVPVIRDVDRKGLWELAEESAALAARARDGKLAMSEMQGGCFTISSLGAIGGTGFTPIINVPEVSILAVSRAEMRPVWDGETFVPRQMLPLSLSYDHRAVNGADAGRFMTYLTEVLADLRRLLL